jgi:hypothetical protein
MAMPSIDESTAHIPPSPTRSCLSSANISPHDMGTARKTQVSNPYSASFIYTLIYPSANPIQLLFDSIRITARAPLHSNSHLCLKPRVSILWRALAVLQVSSAALVPTLIVVSQTLLPRTRLPIMRNDSQSMARMFCLHAQARPCCS